MGIDTSNFNSKQFMVCNAAIGAVYCAISMKYQLLKQTTLKMQVGALAISGFIIDHRVTKGKDSKPHFYGVSTFLVLGVTVLTKESLKVKGISTAVLTLSQLGVAQLCKTTTQDKRKNPLPKKEEEDPLNAKEKPPLPIKRKKPLPKERKEPRDGDFIPSEISEEELYQDSPNVRGFDKLVQETWLAEQIKKLCGDRAYFVDRITDESCELLDLPKLFAKNPAPKTLPSVMLVNYHQHFSVVVYQPTDQKVRCFNSLSGSVNPIEKQVIGAMKKYFTVTGNLRNQHCPQKEKEGEGWSCAFQVLYFLENFLRGDALSTIDASPQPKKEVARRFSSYFSFLKAELVKIPEGYEIFYNSVLEGKPLTQLATLLTTQCKNGWLAQDGENQKEVTKCSTRVECILIKLWELQEEDDDKTVFPTFIQQLDLTKSQRRFLDKAVGKIQWSREAISNLFFETYLQVKGGPVSPD